MAKEKVKVEWIKEADAAAMLNLSREHFRSCVKDGTLPGINYTRPHYRCHLYDKASIEAYLLSISTVMA